MKQSLDDCNCPGCRRERRERQVFWAVFISIGLVAFVLTVTPACTSTVTPDAVRATEASYDGNTRNSGFMGFFADGSGHITPHARDRYNLLLTIYGREYLPPLTRDAGIAALTDGTFQIDALHLTAFIVMSDKHRAGIAPIKP